MPSLTAVCCQTTLPAHCRYRIKAYPENSRLAVLTFNAATATSTREEQGTVFSVGGSAGQLPPGRWRLAVVAENTNSQAG